MTLPKGRVAADAVLDVPEPKYVRDDPPPALAGEVESLW
jgi:hypothetical protein